MIKKTIVLLSIALLASCASSDRRTHEQIYIKDGKCALHNVSLVDEVVPIEYGLLAVDNKYYEYHDKYFPNYEPFVMGGCVI
jgi:hypothetical protein